MEGRNFEKELGITQQHLTESRAKEVMLTAIVDDLMIEIASLKNEITELHEMQESKEVEKNDMTN